MSGPFQRIVRRDHEAPDDRPPEDPSAPVDAGPPDAPPQQTAAFDPVDQPTDATAPIPPAALEEQPTTLQPAVGEPAQPEPVPPGEQATTVQPAVGEPAQPAPEPPPGEQLTTVQPEPAAAPAQEQPAPPAEPRRPGFRERGRLRRRLRYLRKLRELQVRDLGGLVFDLRRFERKRDDLVAQKIDQIRASDDELRTLETALDERRDLRDVHEPGIGGTCPRCFALFGSTDRFCANCGAALGGAVQGPAQVPAAPPQPPTPPLAATPPVPPPPAPGADAQPR